MSLPFEYLDTNRPDLFSEKSTVKQTKGVVKTDENILTTMLIVFVSAVIFITLVAWADVIRSYLDSKIIDKVIEKQTRSRLIFALTMTYLSIIVFLICAYIYQKFHEKKSTGKI